MSENQHSFEHEAKFNAEQFTVRCSGPDDFGRFIAETSSTRDDDAGRHGPSGIGYTPDYAIAHAWDRFELTRVVYDR